MEASPPPRKVSCRSTSRVLSGCSGTSTTWLVYTDATSSSMNQRAEWMSWTAELTITSTAVRTSSTRQCAWMPRKSSGRPISPASIAR